MAVIITYDIPSKHREFKEKMFELGYRDSIPGIKNCKEIYFPNTTLYHQNKSASNAVADARSICKQLNISLTRCVSTIWDSWSADCGEPFN